MSNVRERILKKMTRHSELCNKQSPPPSMLDVEATKRRKEQG